MREWANGFVARQTGVGGAVAGSWSGWPRELGIGAAVGVVLGVLGPFGSYLNGTMPERLAYWVSAVLIGTLLLGLARRVALAASCRWSLPIFPSLVVATVAGSVPIAASCHAVATTLWSGPIRAVPALVWYGQTLVVAAILPLVHLLAGHGQVGPVPAGRPAGEAGSFLARLPAHLGQDLLALQMEDHYVRAHTRLGSALILIPLRQALEELADVPGIRTHRSWWVARSAVAGCVRDGRNVRLRLTNGLEAPVARASVAGVRAAGLMGA